MLIVEDRHITVRAPHDRGDLVEKAFARILVLPEPVDRIFAMLADEQHRVHGEFLAAERHGLGNRAEHWNLESPRDFVGGIVLW